MLTNDFVGLWAHIHQIFGRGLALHLIYTLYSQNEIK